MSEWDRSDVDGMELVNSAQYHEGIDKLWNALKDEDGNLDTQGKNVYTLAAEAIEERDGLYCMLDAGNAYEADLEADLQALRCLNNNLWNRIHILRSALSIISNVSSAIGWRGCAFSSWIKLAKDTLEGKYN